MEAVWRAQVSASLAPEAQANAPLALQASSCTKTPVFHSALLPSSMVSVPTDAPTESISAAIPAMTAIENAKPAQAQPRPAPPAPPGSSATKETASLPVQLEPLQVGLLAFPATLHAQPVSEASSPAPHARPASSSWEAAASRTVEMVSTWIPHSTAETAALAARPAPAPPDAPHASTRLLPL